MKKIYGILAIFLIATMSVSALKGEKTELFQRVSSEELDWALYQGNMLPYNVETNLHGWYGYGQGEVTFTAISGNFLNEEYTLEGSFSATQLIYLDQLVLMSGLVLLNDYSTWGSAIIDYTEGKIYIEQRTVPYNYLVFEIEGE